MFYIFVGFAIILVIAVLWFIDRYASASEMMSNFSNSAFKKLMIGLSIAAVLSFGYGIYAKITYQPPFLDISVNGGEYTVFGDIGDIGYYADDLVYKGEKTTLRIVTWEELNLNEKTEIMISYPSGKEVLWKPSVSKVDVKINEIAGIYKLSPYTFEETGNVELTMRGTELNFTIDVKRKE